MRQLAVAGLAACQNLANSEQWGHVGVTGLAAASGAADDIGYFEWSAATDDINDPENWKAANPALGYTVHEDNIRAVLNDPPDVVRTEVLCRWVPTISSAIPQDAWNECGEDDLQLDPLAPTWLGLDFSPDRRSAALVGAQKMSEDRFQVRLLHLDKPDRT